MRLDHAARLERLLAGHDDIAQVPGASGNGTLIRKDQLLVAWQDADAVHDRARRWVERRDDDPTGVSVLHLRPAAKVDVCDLTTNLADGARHRQLSAGPNHILVAGPSWGFGPSDDPEPTDVTPPAPAPEAGERRVVTVAILDTGISAHPWFVERPWFAACGDDVRESPDADHDDRLDSVAGHGTFIAGVVLQHAPDAELLIERVMDKAGVTDELLLTRGLFRLRSAARATGSPIDLVSLSLGCYTHDDRPSPVLQRSIAAFGDDTVFVAAAGNAASDRPYWPAALKGVIAVGSLDATGTDRASFSNYGWWVDACTIGEHVLSSFFSFDGLGPAGEEKFDGYATWSGTSFAAPHVAATIAARAAHDGVDARRAAAELLDSSRHRSMPDLGVFVDVAGRGAAP
jgi:subtilisin family serine protease